MSKRISKRNTKKYLIINHTLSTLKWTPSMAMNWDNNYKDLMHKISKKFKINNFNSIIYDEDNCEIADGDDLEVLWTSLVLDDERKLFENIHVKSINKKHVKQNKESEEHKPVNIRKHKRDETDSGDINDITNALIDDMKIDTIRSLQSSLNLFEMDWIKGCNAIRHEMWPKLASAVTAIINNKNNKIIMNNLSETCINKVIDILENKRHLATEERDFLYNVLKRASKYDYGRIKRESVMAIPTTTNIYQDFDSKMVGLNKSLLMDIFDVHSIFKYFNFNYKEYTVNDYVHDIKSKRCKKILGSKFIEQYIKNIQFYQRFDLHNTYVVDDDMFEIFNYHFGVSLFVNKIKNNLFIDKGKYFCIQSIVIPQSVSSIYDETLKFKCNIDRVEKYLIKKNICDFYKTKLSSQTKQNEYNMVDLIESWFNIEDIKNNKYHGLMIIIDTRGINDLFYIFPHRNDQQTLEWDINYFVAFDFTVCANINGNKNKVVTHFRYGQNQMTRFYPEMLTTLIPTIFRSPSNLSKAQYLDKIYDNQFKHGWCVTLEDEMFDKYYKIITGFDHIHINYNRELLSKEINNEKEMLCFMDLLKHEIQTKNIENVSEFYKFIEEHEYDSESIIDDIMFEWDENIGNVHSNIAQFTDSFDEIEQIITGHYAPAEKHQIKECNPSNILNPNECPYIEIIIDALYKFEQEQYDNINLCDLMSAYDHIISVHRFCGNNTISSMLHEQIKSKQSKTFEEKQQHKEISIEHQYILDKLGGFCTQKECPILHKHVTRRREEDDASLEYETDDSLKEIMEATLNALHCYILHEKKELFRLQRESKGDAHFITSIGNQHDNNNEIKSNQEIESPKSVAFINFGVSVLEWLEYGEESRYKSLHDEIISNPESTINEKMYLNFKQECFIKMNYNKYNKYLLNELIALKIYTDTNSFQSSLRKAFWHSSKKDVKILYYQWALQLYKTHLYHAKHIPRWALNSKSPMKLYHGLNELLVLKDARPKYNGPISTSLEKSVAHTFSNGTGSLWTMRPSYNNQFKFILGISVDWISCHKNEAEILLIDQYLPIETAINFDENPETNVDHLLYTIKTYRKNIFNKDQFYDILGTTFDKEWLPFIKKHDILYDKIEYDPNQRVLNVLVEELEIEDEDLFIGHQLLTSKFVVNKIYNSFNYCSFKLEINDKYLNSTNHKCFSGATYKIIDNDNNDEKYEKYDILRYVDTLIINRDKITSNKRGIKSCKVFVKNYGIFGNNKYIQLQNISINSKSFSVNQALRSNEFGNCLHLEENAIISLRASLVYQKPEYYEEIINSTFILTWMKKPKLSEHDKITVLDRNFYSYSFTSINEIHFLIPYDYIYYKNINIYVQMEKGSDYMLIKTFRLKLKQNTRTSDDRKARIDHLLNILRGLRHPITNSHDFLRKVGCNINDDQDILFMKQNEKLYQKLIDNESKTVLHRVYEELHITQFEKQYKILTSTININVFPAFGAFFIDTAIDHLPENRIFYPNTRYRIIDVDDGLTEKMFKYGSNAVIKNDNLQNKSYEIEVKNDVLFKKNQYISIKTVGNDVFNRDKNANYLSFLQGLKHEHTHLITFKPPKDTMQQMDVQHVLIAKYVILCNLNNVQNEISPSKISVNDYIYSFNKIKDICFIAPFRKNLNKICLYVQLLPNTNFILIKTFDDIHGENRKNNKKNQIDYLLEILKIYPSQIENSQNFYNKLNVSVNKNDTAIIKKNDIIYEKAPSGQLIIERLIDEFGFDSLSKSLFKYQSKMNNVVRSSRNAQGGFWGFLAKNTPQITATSSTKAIRSQSVYNRDKMPTKVLLLGTSGMSSLFSTIKSMTKEIDSSTMIQPETTTTGVWKYTFKYDKDKYTLIQVGGQKSERKKWIHQFSSIPIVLFITSLNLIDAVLFENRSRYAMHEAIELFQEICQSKWFRNSTIILLLSDDHLFKQSLRTKEKSLDNCFKKEESGWNGKQWNGPNYADYDNDDNKEDDEVYFNKCYNKAIEFIQDVFMNNNESESFMDRKDRIRSMTLSGDKSDNVQQIFAEIRHAIVQNMLMYSGIF